MALLAQRLIDGLTPARFSRTRPPATEGSPDRIIMGPRAGHATSPKPPVKIFLGSERHQFRAERAFLWSIEQHRDPSRTYEIHLMRDLRGFSRGFWLTGFTNYRFAIPAFCEYQGRAIYNDADQVYLTDPALLFDQDMQEAGFLSISDRDTSVMLIDCARMANAWNKAAVRNKSRKQLESVARQANLWGPLDEGWNARDKEFTCMDSKLVHFTTLHTQPWRPFPSQLVYFKNPTGKLWPEIEESANKQAFLPFTALKPSRHWHTVFLYLTSQDHAYPWIDYLRPSTKTTKVNQIDVSGLFDRVPDQDVLWVMVKLLSHCKHLNIHIKEPVAHGKGVFKRSLGFWIEHLDLAQKMQPETGWVLHHQSSPLKRAQVIYGGPAKKGSVVVLTHKKPGHDQQAKALGEALATRTGSSLHSLPLLISEPAFVIKHLLFRRPPVASLPDDAAILVAGGWLPTRMARLFQSRHPYLRLVLSGRKAGPPPNHGGAVVQCRHFGLPPHPRRIETLLPLNSGHFSPCEDGSKWSTWQRADLKVACLLGGNTKSYRYDLEDMQALAKALTKEAGATGRILIVGSRRSQALISMLGPHLPSSALVYSWRADDPANPYSLALAHSDALIVTGESESMLADAVNSGHGFSIFYPPKPLHRPIDKLGHWVAQRAVQPTYNRRGSIRPQQGLQYLCARLLERNWVLPPRDLQGLHRTLCEQGLASLMNEARVRNCVAPQILDEATQQLIECLNLCGNNCPDQRG